MGPLLVNFRLAYRFKKVAVSGGLPHPSIAWFRGWRFGIETMIQSMIGNYFGGI